MALPVRHSFHLELPGLPELADMARAFLHRVITFADFQGEEAEHLCNAACAALSLVEKAVEARRDIDLPIELHAIVDADALEISILEHGIPLAEGSAEVRGIGGLSHVVRVFDDVSWEQRGEKGSELHLRRARSHPEITTIVAVEHRLSEEHLEEAEENVEPGRECEYTIRQFQPEDALEVARRVYESYGRSYPNPDLFYPGRIITLNEKGQLSSIVAESSEGSIVGHYAIEMPHPHPIGEAGIAVIDPAHRGRGLLNAMRAKLIDVAQRRELLGLWSQPTTRHPYSQRMNISSGSTPCGLLLGTTPSSTELRSADDQESGLRYSCFLYWLALSKEEPIVVSVPESVASLIEAIYAERGRPATIETSCDTLPDPGRHAEKGVQARFDRARKSGWIELVRIDSSAPSLVREAMTMLIEIAGAEVVYVDIPVSDPGCARLASDLMEEDLIFAGIGPRFVGEDVLRLQRVVAPVDLDGLVVEGELGGRIAEYVLSSVRG